MKLEEITNETIYTIDWAREDRQRMLKKLSAREPIADKSGLSRRRPRRTPTWRAWLQSAMASLREKVQRAFAERRARYFDLCEEIQRHGYLAGWRHASTWPARSGKGQAHEQMRG